MSVMDRCPLWTDVRYGQVSVMDRCPLRQVLLSIVNTCGCIFHKYSGVCYERVISI